MWRHVPEIHQYVAGALGDHDQQWFYRVIASTLAVDDDERISGVPFPVKHAQLH